MSGDPETSANRNVEVPQGQPLGAGGSSASLAPWIGAALISTGLGLVYTTWLLAGGRDREAAHALDSWSLYAGFATVGAMLGGAGLAILLWLGLAWITTPGRTLAYGAALAAAGVFLGGVSVPLFNPEIFCFIPFGTCDEDDAFDNVAFGGILAGLALVGIGALFAAIGIFWLFLRVGRPTAGLKASGKEPRTPAA